MDAPVSLPPVEEQTEFAVVVQAVFDRWLVATPRVGTPTTYYLGSLVPAPGKWDQRISQTYSQSLKPGMEVVLMHLGNKSDGVAIVEPIKPMSPMVSAIAAGYGSPGPLALTHASLKTQVMEALTKARTGKEGYWREWGASPVALRMPDDVAAATKPPDIAHGFSQGLGILICLGILLALALRDKQVGSAGKRGVFGSVLRSFVGSYGAAGYQAPPTLPEAMPLRLDALVSPRHAATSGQSQPSHEAAEKTT